MNRGEQRKGSAAAMQPATLSERLLALARERGVRLHEGADLAQVLAALDPDAEVPAPAMLVLGQVMGHLFREARRGAPGEEDALDVVADDEVRPHNGFEAR